MNRRARPSTLPATGVAAEARWSAERPPPGGLPPGEVAVSAATAGALGMAEGTPVRLRAVGRAAWAYVRIDDAVTDEHVALGFELWSMLRVRPGDPVHADVSDDRLPAADRVAVRTPQSLPVRNDDALRDLLVAEQALTFRGARPWVGTPGFSVEVLESVPSPAVVAAATSVELVGQTLRDHKPEGLGDVGGLDAVVERLSEDVVAPLTDPGRYRRLGIRPVRGVLLHGPPGTGKTLACRALAQELGVDTYLQDVTELVGSYPGETEKNLRDLFRTAARDRPALIVLDEVDVLATHRQRLASHTDLRAVSQLLELLDGLTEIEGIVVIGTTNRLSTIDPAFRRPGRFDTEIAVPMPDSRARHEILDIHTRAMPLSSRAVTHLRTVTERTAGFVGADLMSLAREAALCALRRSPQDPEAASVVVEPDDFDRALTLVRPSMLREERRRDRSQGPDLVGRRQQRRLLLDAARERLNGAEPAVGEGVLLHGPAGGGKTALVTALARELGVNLVVVEPGRIFNQWLGESEVALADLFERARHVRPSVVVIDHLEAIAPQVGPTGDAHATRRVTAALLGAIERANEDPGVLVVGLARALDAVDDAVTRPGRLGVHIELGDPDGAERREVARSILGTAPQDGPKLDQIVKETQGLGFGALVAHLRSVG